MKMLARKKGEIYYFWKCEKSNTWKFAKIWERLKIAYRKGGAKRPKRLSLYVHCAHVNAKYG